MPKFRFDQTFVPSVLCSLDFQLLGCLEVPPKTPQTIASGRTMRAGRAGDGQRQADEQELVDAVARELLRVDPLQNEEAALVDEKAMDGLRVAPDARRRDFQRGIVTGEGSHTLSNQPFGAVERQAAAVARGQSLGIRPVEHCAGADEDEVALAKRDALLRAGGVELLPHQPADAERDA